MNQRVTLLASIFISAFILVVIAGVIAAVNFTRVQASAALTPDVQQAIADRDAAYTDLINQANQRIEQLNQQVAALQDPTSAAASALAQATLTSEEVAKIAQQAAGVDEILQQVPELVDYQGKTVYLVTYTDGLVYVDAQTGEVLYNGVPQRIDAQRAAEIAGEYLGGMSPKYAVVKTVKLNGTEIYKVNFGDIYYVYIDKFGSVLKAQVFQVSNNAPTSDTSSNSVSQSSGGSNTSSPSGGEHETDAGDD
jgi:uncharacterized membrane protein YkoI